MIVLLFPFVGFFAAVAGFIISAGWWSLSLLFGIAPPTPDQTSGLMLAAAVLSQISLAAILAWTFLTEAP